MNYTIKIKTKDYAGYRDLGGKPRAYCKNCKSNRYFIDGKCKECGVAKNDKP